MINFATCIAIKGYIAVIQNSFIAMLVFRVKVLSQISHYSKICQFWTPNFGREAFDSVEPLHGLETQYKGFEFPAIST